MRRLLTALFLAWLVAFVAPAIADAQTTPPFTATVTANANLRSGPGITYAVVGRAAEGATVQVSECNTDCSWYQLDSGNWIAAFLVEPVIGEPSAPASAPTSTAPVRSYTMPTMSSLMVAQVVRITDGDTIRARIAGAEYPLRYIGVNTPEVGQPYAAEATALNSTLVSGQAVYLEKDVSDTDRYNRLLRYVWLADGTFVNYELVRQGYAQVATYPPDVKYEALYLEAQRQAMAEGAGLWAESAPATTATPVPAQSAGATANRNANLRGGPGTSYAIVGSVSSGQALQIVGRNQAGDWYQLASGAWIAAFLVNNAPSGLAVVAAPAAPVAPAEPTPVPVDATTRSGGADGPVPPTATPVPPTPAPPIQSCDPNYAGACIPLVGYDLDCPDVGVKRFQSIGSDPHGFDGDDDGIACER